MKENNNNRIYILAIVVSLILGVTIVGSTIGIVAVKLRSKNTVNQAITAKEEETSVVSKQNEITPTVAETKAVNYSPDSGCDWASLYYEALSVIDGADKKTCALINLNDDDIPELFISSDEDITRSQLFSISENGFFVPIHDIFAKSTFLYRERTGSCCARSKYDDPAGHFFYKFDGRELTIVTHKTAEEKNKTAEEFDFDTASQPNSISVNAMLRELSQKRQKTQDTAGAYNGSGSELVSTYLSMETEADIGGNKGNVVYRIPQINLGGSDIDRVNREILDQFEGIANRTKETGETTVTLIDYQTYCRNGILSLITTVSTAAPDGFCQTVYNFDIAGQREISNLCLLNSYGYFGSSVEEAFKTYERQKCDKERTTDHTGKTDDYFDKQYQYAVDFFSPFGNQMYFDDSGSLIVFYKERSDTGVAEKNLQAKLQLNNQLKGLVTSE